MFEKLISWGAVRWPDAIAIATPSRSLTYGEFARQIRRCITVLDDGRFWPRKRVLVNVADPMLHWVFTAALEELGCIPAAVNGARLGPGSADYLGAEMIICDAALDPSVGWAPQLVVDQAWLDAMAAAPEAGPTRHVREQTDGVRIVATSGTTGTNKKILLTRQSMDLRVMHTVMSQVFLNPRPKLLSIMGPGSIAGYTLGYSVWGGGGTLCFHDPAKGIMENLRRLDADTVALAPFHLQILLSSLPEGFKAKPGFSVFLVGGSLSKVLAEETRRRLTADVMVLYGSTETGAVTQGHMDMLDGAEDSTGYVRPWAEVQIIGPDGRVRPHGEVGEVRVRSDELIYGYLDDETLDESCFRDGWFMPRDLGVLSAGGILTILGRTDDLMNIGGAKVLPSRGEARALKFPGVIDAAMFAAPDAQGIDTPWIAFVGAADLDAAAFMASMTAALGRPLKSMQIGQIPRNALGKIERATLRALTLAQAPVET